MTSSQNAYSDDGFFSIRVLFFGFLCWYSLQFFTLGVNTEVMNAFIHGPNLIFHEAGHVLFMPFGNFMMILGGSLFQCLLPAILATIFYTRENNTFGAVFCLWWFGQNLTDVALYISDASARSLPLIGGMSEEAHDWGNLLTLMNLLEYDTLIGNIVHSLGMLIMLTSLILGGRFLVRSFIYTHTSR
jgi:hypothetical protein